MSANDPEQTWSWQAQVKCRFVSTAPTQNGAHATRVENVYFFRFSWATSPFSYESFCGVSVREYARCSSNGRAACRRTEEYTRVRACCRSPSRSYRTPLKCRPSVCRIPDPLG